jgi:hypothetical protein
VIQIFNTHNIQNNHIQSVSSFNKLMHIQAFLISLLISLLASTFTASIQSSSNPIYDCKPDFESAFGPVDCVYPGTGHLCTVCIDSELDSKMEWRVRDVDANTTIFHTVVSLSEYQTFLKGFEQQATGGFSARMCCGAMNDLIVFSMKFLDNISHTGTTITFFADDLMIATTQVSREASSTVNNGQLTTDNGTPDVMFMFKFPQYLIDPNTTNGSL